MWRFRGQSYRELPHAGAYVQVLLLLQMKFPVPVREGNSHALNQSAGLAGGTLGKSTPAI